MEYSDSRGLSDNDAHTVYIFSNTFMANVKCVTLHRRDHCRLNIQAFPCHLANVVPKDSESTSH